MTEQERQRIHVLGSDLRLVWTAPTTTDCDRKELLRTLLEEVILNVERKEKERHADLTLHGRGGMITNLDVHLKSYQVHGPETDEDTLSLLRRLAAYYPDDVIARIFNRQQRKPACGGQFKAGHVARLRRYHNICGSRKLGFG